MSHYILITKNSMIILLSLVAVLTTAAAQGQGVSLSKPGCREKCGNVVVPYPFGIGINCSAETSFTILCNETLNPPRASMLVMRFEQVVEISLSTKTITVMQAVSPVVCSRERNNLKQLAEVLITFVFSSTYNRLVVVGCQNVVSLLPSYGECNPICGSSTMCNGINCCQNVIQPRQREIEFFYRNSEVSNDSVGLSCGYVFVTDQRWLANEYINHTALHNFSFPTRISSQIHTPLVLEWEFDAPLLQGVVCNKSSTNTTICSCASGYEGNPYLPGGGCHDINECMDSKLNNTCQLGSSCVNTNGSFTCQVQAQNDDGGPQMTTIVIGVSCGIGALLLLGGAWLLSKLVRKRVEENRKQMFFKRNGGVLLEQQFSSGDGGIEKIKLFDSKELSLATDRYNENRILGRGGQGTVYKGMLANGRIVAVKKSKKMDEADIQVFVNEVVILSQINHRNVVKLLGCCLETEVPLLVYEFIPNGTLFQHIHDENKEFPLSWNMRVRIATEIAGALAYLHSAASVPIYHRDIKSTNILLDEKYRAKVSDFGTSRSFDIDQTHVTTRVMGTFGYMDPEYFRSNQFTEKSDVYSFGVVILELLTGEKAITAARDEGGRSLVAQFLHSMEVNRLFDILDPEVVGEGGKEAMVAVAKLARRCLDWDSKRRPTMKEAAVELEGIRMMGEGPVLQSQNENPEFHSIEVPEVYDISSILDSTTFNSTTTESSTSPLLFGNSRAN